MKIEEGVLVAIVKGPLAEENPFGIIASNCFVQPGNFRGVRVSEERLITVKEQDVIPLGKDCRSLSVAGAINHLLPSMLRDLLVTTLFLQEQINQHKKQNLCHKDIDR